MTDVLHDLATARQPQQERGVRRFEAVMEEAERLLVEEGLNGFSIPTLAERLGFTRRSIYKFFPTPYAVLNELTRRQLQELERRLTSAVPALLQMSYSDTVAEIVRIGAEFYNGSPIARLLILGGPVTDSSYHAQNLTLKLLGDWNRSALAARGVTLPPSPPDVSTLLVEIVLACYRQSYLQHGEIIPAYCDEAAYAMKAYLSRYIEQPS